MHLKNRRRRRRSWFSRPRSCNTTLLSDVTHSFTEHKTSSSTSAATLQPPSGCYQKTASETGYPLTNSWFTDLLYKYISKFTCYFHFSYLPQMQDWRHLPSEGFVRFTERVNDPQCSAHMINIQTGTHWLTINKLVKKKRQVINQVIWVRVACNCV